MSIAGEMRAATSIRRYMAPQNATATVDDSRQILNAAHDAFVAMDGDGAVTGWNMQAEALFGWTSTEAMGRPVSELIVPRARRADHEARLRRFLDTGQTTAMGQRVELEGMRRDGELLPLEISAWAIHRGGEWGVYWLCRDITDRKIHDEDLAYRALHDELTGLANRSLAIDRINHALARQSRHGLDVAVLFLDLDRFKAVNDSLGHPVGDQLLRAVAQRLTSAVRPADTVARIAGDEFAIICDGLSALADATRLANRILQALTRPVDLAADLIRVDASIGIALAEQSSDSAEGLLRNADVAMYWAKQHGGGRAAVFDKTMRGRLHNRLRTEQQLAEAVARQQFRLHYQPVVDLADGHIVGVEALVRWHHPQCGLLLPAEFLPLAEETGQIVPIGTWVLREALQQARRWLRLGCADLIVTVNLSARQLSQSGFVDTVAAILAEAEVDPNRIGMDFEVTESLLMNSSDAIADTLGALRSLGVGLAIDNFGAHQSSLADLKRFPVDTVKIDRSFITDIDTDPRNLAIVNSVVNLGHALDLTVLAEGVETGAQRQKLAESGCDLAQGYHFGRPVPPSDITRRLSPR